MSSFAIRSVNEKDITSIHELSLLMNFINIPRDPKKLQAKILRSVESFENPEKDKEKNIFIFVLEDLSTNKIHGVSLIHGLHGNQKEPHFFFKVGQEHKYSKSLNTGFIHGTLKFGYTSKGFTEIGGLILDPKFRKHDHKLGKALSFSRFLFIAQNKNLFTDTIHVELMPPFDSKGNSPLWEAIGRRFLNMDYFEADLLSRNNKEFILNLFPNDTIYEALLPLEARDAIGKVGKETEPVKRMLKNIGFKYTNEVDPFDGGPHYRAKVEDITLIKEMTKYPIKYAENGVALDDGLFILHLPSKEHHFFSIISKGKLNGDEVQIENFEKNLKLPKEAIGFRY